MRGVYQSARKPVIDVAYYNEDAPAPMRRFFLYDSTTCDKTWTQCGPAVDCFKWHTHVQIPLSAVRCACTMTSDASSDGSGRRRRRGADEEPQHDSEGRPTRQHNFTLAPASLQKAQQGISEDEKQGYKLDT